MAKPPSSTQETATPVKSTQPSTGSTARRGARAKPNLSQKNRDTLVSLRNHIDDVFLRLKEADQLTKKSILALETAFKILEKRAGEDANVNRAALTKRVDQLGDHLTGLISQTQQAVAHDLKAVLANPSEPRLKAAINAAESRVAKAEMEQAEALTKVNLHIAELAKAVDARMAQETRDREAALKLVRENLAKNVDHMSQSVTQVETKLQSVEASSAKAILQLGERIATLNEDFTKRTESNTQAIGAKMSEIALKTQNDFEAFRNNLERRVESLEDNQRNLDSYTDRSIATLSTRLDNLEYGLTSAAEAVSRPVQDNSPVPSTSAPPTPVIEDAFSPETPLASTTAPTLTVVHDATQTPQYSPIQEYPTETYAPQTYQPQEFVPTEFTPHGHHPAPSPAPSYTPAPDEPLAYTTSPMAAPVPETPAAPPQFEALNPGQEFVVDELPYDNPAYAETSSESGMDRPGAFKGKKDKKAKRPPGKGRNLRVAGLAVAAVAVGYFALRGFTGSGDETASNSSEGMFIEDTSGTAPVATMPSSDAETTVVENTPVIGEYEDNQGEVIDANTSAAETLQQAARDGDAAAEFQLGLSYMQSGRTEQAVGLIRSAANKGQPAAQYRLAKLYESGEGVEADPAVARQLTERAARAGNRIAMHDLALYYAEGRGDVEINIATAAQWFEKAAERGVVDSQFNLGVLFESGQGLPKNLADAYVWYSIAAKQGDQFARQRLDVLEQQLNQADLKKAQSRADKFKPTKIDEEANGIFKNAAWSVSSRGNVGPAGSQIREAQTLLGQLGYDAGTPDGAMGPKTRSAIISFQKQNNLNETGDVNMALIAELQRAAGA